MEERKLQTGRYERTLVSTPVFFFVSPFSSSSPQEEEDDAATAGGRARAHYFSALARFVRFPLSFSPSLPVSFLSFFSFAFLLSFLFSSFLFFFFPSSLLTDFPAVTKARLKCSSVGASQRMCRVKPQATGSSWAPYYFGNVHYHPKSTRWSQAKIYNRSTRWYTWEGIYQCWVGIKLPFRTRPVINQFSQ